MSDLKQWQQQGRFFSYQSHRLFFREAVNADAPVLLVIHGFPTSSFDYHLIWSKLSAHFRVVTLDMLGYGLSDKPVSHQYSIASQVDIIESLLAHLNIGKYHILAHDYGDTICQELIARDLAEDRRKIESAALLNGGLFIESQRPVLLQKLLLSPLGTVIARFTSYSKFKKNFDHICAVKLAEAELAAFWQLITHNDGIKVMHGLIQYIKERKKYRARWVGALTSAQCPIRFICGVEDPVSGQRMIDRYRELIPNPDVVALEGIGHYPQVESPSLVIEHLEAFWRRYQVI